MNDEGTEGLNHQERKGPMGILATGRVTWVIAALSVTAACVATPTEDNAIDEAEAPAELLLAEVRVSDDHVVRFWQEPNGALSIEEQARAAEGVTFLPDRIGFAEAYRRLVPEAGDDGVPAALLAADARIAAMATGRAGTAEVTSVRESKASQPLSKASPDYYGDNWGAQWFLDGWCYPNDADGRRCDTNTYGFESRANDVEWYKVCAMAGDFEHGNHLLAMPQKCSAYPVHLCSFREEHVDIAARWVHCKEYYQGALDVGNSDRYKAFGNDATGHMHWSVRWDWD